MLHRSLILAPRELLNGMERAASHNFSLVGALVLFHSLALLSPCLLGILQVFLSRIGLRVRSLRCSTRRKVLLVQLAKLSMINVGLVLLHVNVIDTDCLLAYLQVAIESFLEGLVEALHLHAEDVSLPLLCLVTASLVNHVNSERVVAGGHGGVLGCQEEVRLLAQFEQLHVPPGVVDLALAIQVDLWLDGPSGSHAACKVL